MISEAIRRQVAERAGYYCEYCRCPEFFSSSSYEIEHIQPSAEGGADTPDNLAYSCTGCNRIKNDGMVGRDTLTGEPVSLFHPRRDDWHEHFAWGIEPTQLVGLTPTGRATVARLKLNRPNVRYLRFALTALGWHPPRMPQE